MQITWKQNILQLSSKFSYENTLNPGVSFEMPGGSRKQCIIRKKKVKQKAKTNKCEECG